MARYIPQKDSPQVQTLRDAAKIAGVQGADSVDAFKFQSNAPTELRNQSINATKTIEDNPQVRLGDAEVAKQLADTLKHAGPATFRNIRDAIGIDKLGEIQQQYNLQNIPTSILPVAATGKTDNKIVTTGNSTEFKDLNGVRNSFAKSLKPETPAAAARRDIIKKRSQEDLATAQENQLDEQMISQARGQQQPNIFQRAVSAIQGIGGNFLDRLSNAQPAPAPQPTDTSLSIPDTGETLDFSQGSFAGNVDPLMRQLEDEAGIAISQGADPIKVRERLAQHVQQLKAKGRTK